MASNQLPDILDQTESADEAIRPGLLRRYLHGGRIAVFTLTDISSAIIDAWAEETIAHVVGHPADVPCLLLHDVSRHNLVLTPYGRQRAADVAQANPEVSGRAAILLPRGASGVLLRMFINHLKQQSGGREQQAFLTKRRALIWLEEGLTGLPPTT